MEDSSSSEDMGIPGCNWWLDDSATGTGKQPEETAREVKSEKVSPEKEPRVADGEEEQEKNRSSQQEQSSKADNQAEHSLRENPTTDESVQEETKIFPVKACVEWDISHENQTIRRSGRKTKRPDWLDHNVMLKKIDRKDDVVE